MKKKIQSYFSLLGKSFLMAVAVMSFFALLLSIGAVLKNPYFVEAMPFLGNRATQFVAEVLNESGLIVIRFMPLVFAVSIAIGLSPKGDKELAAFSALIGYFFMISFSALTLKFFGLALEPDVLVGDNHILSVGQTLEMRKAMQTMVLGLQTIDTGVLGGIIVGMSASAITKRFKNQKLPMIFSFYQGKHFPPIMTGLVFMFVGILVTFVWPVLGNSIYATAGFVVSGTGVIG
ncbi:PTS transporter subunit EIIC [Candidatus Enterococcus courvalinii]|uniref:PTS transporter subunit EIIC n=1 Tax=Candidatus Enterococcus courvalinii TaxID=2815329 RepID=A0ABS3HXB2_9ENTE|nr:PTS transporter subunit EIIC [Enterococcus sp. MSG2901]MBO0481041.1 PTS transporter subunit EIIC [Enterococcus sp. MSG2901]